MSTTNGNTGSHKNSMVNKNIKFDSRLLRQLMSALCTFHW